MSVEISLETSVEVRAALHAALADPARVAIVDALELGDRTPGELAASLRVSSNLLAHHLGVLDEAGIVERRPSSGDGRRVYVHLLNERLDHLDPLPTLRARRILFVCTANSARSQLAQAMWNAGRATVRAESAGTHPAGRVHPRAIRAARRRGLDLASSVPRALPQTDAQAIVITVCDQAREELGDRVDVHWSIPDPVTLETREAFDAAADDIAARVAVLRRVTDPSDEGKR